MREGLKKRLARIEAAQNLLPCAVVTFSDGRRGRLDFHEIAVAFSEGNPAGIVSVEWEKQSDDAIVFQLLACPEVWGAFDKHKRRPR